MGLKFFFFSASHFQNQYRDSDYKKIEDKFYLFVFMEKEKENNTSI